MPWLLNQEADWDLQRVVFIKKTISSVHSVPSNWFNTCNSWQNTRPQDIISKYQEYPCSPPSLAEAEGNRGSHKGFSRPGINERLQTHLSVDGQGSFAKYVDRMLVQYGLHFTMCLLLPPPLLKQSSTSALSPLFPFSPSAASIRLGLPSHQLCLGQWFC